MKLQSIVLLLSSILVKASAHYKAFVVINPIESGSPDALTEPIGDNATDALKVRGRTSRITPQLLDPLEAFGFATNVLGTIDFVRNTIASNDFTELAKTLERAESRLDHVEKLLRHSMEHVRIQMEKNQQVYMSVTQYEVMRTQFYASERIIKNSYDHWRAYFHTNTRESLRDFLIASSELVKAINTLLDGLLGMSIFGSDLLTVTQLAYDAHPRKFKQDADGYLELVHIGAAILAANFEYNQIPEANQYYWKVQLAEKELLARAKIQHIEDDCRREFRVNGEMQILMAERNAAKNNQEIANDLLAFLSDKYDTKSWFVLVYDSPRDGEHRKQFHMAKNFHQVIDQAGKNALAASLSLDEVSWTAEERHNIIQTVTDYCLIKTGTNGWRSRMQNALKNQLYLLVDRCQHHRADTVFKELTERIIPVEEGNVRLAVFLGSSNPANAAVFQTGHDPRLSVTYQTFGQFDYCDHFRRLVQPWRVPQWLCQKSDKHEDSKSGLQVVMIPGSGNQNERVVRFLD